MSHFGSDTSPTRMRGFFAIHSLGRTLTRASGYCDQDIETREREYRSVRLQISSSAVKLSTSMDAITLNQFACYEKGRRNVR